MHLTLGASDRLGPATWKSVEEVGGTDFPVGQMPLATQNRPTRHPVSPTCFRPSCQAMFGNHTKLVKNFTNIASNMGGEIRRHPLNLSSAYPRRFVPRRPRNRPVATHDSAIANRYRYIVPFFTECVKKIPAVSSGPIPGAHRCDAGTSPRQARPPPRPEASRPDPRRSESARGRRS